MKKLIIFDVDGTILNTLGSIAYYVNQALEKNGLDKLEVKDYANKLGYSTDYLIKTSLKALGKEEDGPLFDKIKYQYETAYKADAGYLTKPYPAIEDMICELKERGFLVAAVSNKPDAILQKLMKDKFKQGLFDFVIGAKKGIALKPDPQSLEICLEKLGVDKDQAVFVGDTEVDIRTGKNAGVETLGVSWGFRTRDRVEAEKPKKIFDSVEELKEYLIGL